MAKELPRSVAVLLERLSQLSTQEQLLAYEAIRDYLSAAGETVERDPEVERRAESLRILRAVVDHYERADPRQLKAKEFDKAPVEVRGDWLSGRVIRIWRGRWKFALEALAGEKPRQTTEQRAIRRKVGATRLRSDDRWASVRAWIETKPTGRGLVDYDGWAREQRNLAAGDVLPHPLSNTVRDALGYDWVTIVKVAEGTLPLSEAKERRAERRRTFNRGKHDLVSRIEIVEMSGKGTSTVQVWVDRPDFATAVLILQNRRFYLRGDVEAFLAKKPVPERQENELARIYVARWQAAEIAGLTPRSFEMTKDKPAAIALVGGRGIWLRSDIEAYARRRERSRPRRRPKGTE